MTRTFADLGVSKPVVAALAERDVIDAFPIQEAVIEAALAGRDLCGKAPTGSGKTLAFGVPAVDLAEQGSPWRPKVLILAPTRELATQIKDELEPLAKARSRTILTVFGGTNIERDIKRLEQGVDILVACPGRLEDLIGRRCCELRDVRIAIVDEADRMADMGFLPSVKRILDQTPSDRHMLLFSATLDGDVDTLVKRYQRDPETYEVEEQADQIGDVEHSWYLIPSDARIDSAVAVLRSYYSAIVFCRTRRGCDRVAKMIAKKGLPAVAIHGDRSQSQRERALRDFTSGKAQVLVATDVAARGIHVDNVELVMHYDPANSDKDYIHRSGRTGRAGSTGRVISMVVDNKQKIARQLQKELGVEQGFETLDLDSLAPALDVVRPTEPEPERQPKKQPKQRQGNGQGKHKGKPQHRSGDRRGQKTGQGSQQARGRKRTNDERDRDDRASGERDRRDRDGGGRGRGGNQRSSGSGRGGSGTRGSNRGNSRGGSTRGTSGNDRRNRDDRNDRGRGGQTRDGYHPRRKKRGGNDWYPPGWEDDDSKPRGRGSRDDRPSRGGSNSTPKKKRASKGRHADRNSNRNKGKRRDGR